MFITTNPWWFMNKQFKEFSDRLRYIIEQLGRSPNSFAKALGVPVATLMSYLNDNREPKVSFIGMMRKKFPEVNIDWLLLREGEPFLKDQQIIKTELEKKIYEQQLEINQ